RTHAVLDHTSRRQALRLTRGGGPPPPRGPPPPPRPPPPPGAPPPPATRPPTARAATGTARALTHPGLAPGLPHDLTLDMSELFHTPNLLPAGPCFAQAAA